MRIRISCSERRQIKKHRLLASYQLCSSGSEHDIHNWISRVVFQRWETGPVYLGDIDLHNRIVTLTYDHRHTWYAKGLWMVTWATFQMLVSLPVLLHTLFNDQELRLVYTLSVPMVCPYMWYQNCRHEPLVAGYRGLSRRALDPCVMELGDTSVYMKWPKKHHGTYKHKLMTLLSHTDWLPVRAVTSQEVSFTFNWRNKHEDAMQKERHLTK